MTNLHHLVRPDGETYGGSEDSSRASSTSNDVKDKYVKITFFFPATTL